jgi:CIC family chloride channel protein
VLGLVSGGIALLLMRILFHVEDRFEGWKGVPGWFKPAVGGLLLGVIGVGLPQVYADGYDTVDAVLHGGVVGWVVVLLLVAKLVGTAFTLGSGGSGGVFMPALFLGAMTGAMVGQVSGWMLGDLAGSPGGYALVGMGGIVAGAMHAPITAMVMMFELTGNYTIILPLMTVCILSTLVTNLVQRESIYTLKLARSGIDLFRGRTLDIFRELKVADCLRADAPTVGGSAPASQVLQQMLEAEEGILYVVDEQGGLYGSIRLNDLKGVLGHPEALEHGVLAVDLAESRAPVCRPEESLRDALLKFERSGLTELPVVDGDGRLLGVVPYGELIAHYNEEVMRRDTGDAVLRRFAAAREPGEVQVAPGVVLRSWRPPPIYWGKTLSDMALPERYQVQVVLIRRPGEQEGDAEAFILPGRDVRVGDRDIVVVCGQEEKVGGLPG